MADKRLLKIAIGLVVAILAATTLAASLFIVARVRAEGDPPRTFQMPPAYQVYTDFVDVVLIVPPTTPDTEDKAAINDLVRQIHAKGKDARITLCSSRSQVFDTARYCVAIIYFPR